MDLNFNHLFYFWMVAREGGMAQAGRALHVSHPTLSAQVATLEARMGEDLFVRQGRRLVLTEVGRLVFRYADEIFALGREMVETLRGGVETRPHRLHVGVVDVVPKLVVRRLLQAAFALAGPVRIVCREDSHETLVAELALHSLDIVISDEPAVPGGRIRAFSHLLGESGVTIFGAPSLAGTYRPGFPASLHGAPMLLPLEGSTLRRALNQWLDRKGIVPQVIAEFEDSALLKVFGTDGVGLFAAPTVVRREIMEQYKVATVGHLTDVRERFYAISSERRLKHPAVVAISEVAKAGLFAPRTRRARAAPTASSPRA